MGNTSIQWTDRTWNPVRGCSRVSPGCVHCYAERHAARFAAPAIGVLGERGKIPSEQPAAYKAGPFNGFVTRVNGHPAWTGKVELVEKHLADPISWRKPCRVFVNSMSDLFHEDLPDEAIDRVFAVMALCPQHTFQVLTKRPERMLKYCTNAAVAARLARRVDAMAVASEVLSLEEEVRPIPGYDGYYASNLGIILSSKRGETKPMSPDEGEAGHQRVQLHREGAGRYGDRLLVHRLILETFVGKAPSDESQGCHRDGNPRNNAVPNLRWGSQADNWIDRKRHGNGQAWSRLTLQDVESIRAFRKAGLSQENTGAKFGISGTQVKNIERGLQWAECSAWPLANCGENILDSARVAAL